VIPIKDNIPTGTFPFVTLGLILANVVVYILSIRHGGSFFGGPSDPEVLKYGAIPRVILHPGLHCAEVARFSALGQQLGPAELLCRHHLPPGITPENSLPSWQTIFTAMFSHASFIHIAGNMLFLWIFGNNVEDAMGHVKFFLFYIAGGIAALALQIAVGPNSVAPTLGASGAIAAVLGGYILLYPRARVLTFVFIILFFTVIELPAVVMLGVWFAEQAVFGAVGFTNPTGSSGGVAYFAHIGGFLFGLATVKLLATRWKPART
jgi:membrane associated rhomboid family serine protease